MHEPKASALHNLKRYYIIRVQGRVRCEGVKLLQMLIILE